MHVIAPGVLDAVEKERERAHRVGSLTSWYALTDGQRVVQEVRTRLESLARVHPEIAKRAGWVQAVEVVAHLDARVAEARRSLMGDPTSERKLLGSYVTPHRLEVEDICEGEYGQVRSAWGAPPEEGAARFAKLPAARQARVVSVAALGAEVSRGIETALRTRARAGTSFVRGGGEVDEPAVTCAHILRGAWRRKRDLEWRELTSEEEARCRVSTAPLLAAAVGLYEAERSEWEERVDSAVESAQRLEWSLVASSGEAWGWRSRDVQVRASLARWEWRQRDACTLQVVPRAVGRWLHQRELAPGNGSGVEVGQFVGTEVETMLELTLGLACNLSWEELRRAALTARDCVVLDRRASQVSWVNGSAR